MNAFGLSVRILRFQIILMGSKFCFRRRTAPAHLAKNLPRSLLLQNKLATLNRSFQWAILIPRPKLTRICDEMNSTNKAIEDAMRADFESLAPELRATLLDMLCDSGEMTPEWWCELLLGKMPDSPDDIFEH